MERQPISILIAAPTRNTFIKDGQLSDDNSYVKKLAKETITPLIVTPDMSQNQIADLYGRANGLLIPGGADIDSRRYGQEPHDRLMQPINAKLDELQINLVNKTNGDHKPLLGVCRGAQIMAVAHGGTLHQHLPDVTSEKHGISVNMIGEVQDQNNFHHVYITESTEAYGRTKAHTIFEKTKLRRVPTKHHQAVDNPGDLIITGKSPGGIAEIIEHPTLPFHIGVQFHPELSESPKITAIFKKFADAVEHFSEHPGPGKLLIPKQNRMPHELA